MGSTIKKEVILKLPGTLVVCPQTPVTISSHSATWHQLQSTGLSGK